MATSAPRGFTPINLDWSRVHRYYKSAAVALGIGDPVVRSADSSDPLGYGSITRATTGQNVTGVVVGIEPNATRTTKYLASGDTGYVLVADYSDQEFLVQDNGGATGIAVTDCGNHVNHVTALDCDTNTGRSKYQLDTEAKSTGNTWIICRLDDKPDNAAGAYARWVVKANLHTEVNAGVTNVKEI